MFFYVVEKRLETLNGNNTNTNMKTKLHLKIASVLPYCYYFFNYIPLAKLGLPIPRQNEGNKK